jgi:hypothetical protein
MLNACNRQGSDMRVYDRVYRFYAKLSNDGVLFRVFYAWNHRPLALTLVVVVIGTPFLFYIL